MNLQSCSSNVTFKTAYVKSLKAPTHSYWPGRCIEGKFDTFGPEEKNKKQRKFCRPTPALEPRLPRANGCVPGTYMLTVRGGGHKPR